MCDKVFLSDCQLIKRVIAETSSGALLANDCLVHFTVSALPFGGVGECVNTKTKLQLFSILFIGGLKDLCNTCVADISSPLLLR